MNKKLMAVFLVLCTLFFMSIYLIAVNFSSAHDRFNTIQPDLDNYSAAEILYLSFEKVRSEFLLNDNFKNDYSSIRRSILTSKINILNNHATFSEAFFFDDKYIKSLSIVQGRNKELDKIINDYNENKISKNEVLSFFKEMERDIIDLQEVIYEIQIRNFKEVSSVITKNSNLAEAFLMLSVGLFLSIVFIMFRNLYVLKGIIKSKNLFISAIYHELSTSIQKIIMAIELIEDVNYNEELGMINYHSHKLLEQTREILDYSRLELGENAIVLKSFSITDLIYDSINNVNNYGENKIVFYDFTVNPIVCSDKYKLHRVIVNLLDNSCKFTKNGIVYIGVKNKKDKIHITIKDTGIGFDMGNIKKYFQAFNQEAKSETKQGLGLGLTIVQNYVERMSGKLCVHSTLGGGASFCINIPRSLCEKNV